MAATLKTPLRPLSTCPCSSTRSWARVPGARERAMWLWGPCLRSSDRRRRDLLRRTRANHVPEHPGPFTPRCARRISARSSATTPRTAPEPERRGPRTHFCRLAVEAPHQIVSGSKDANPGAAVALGIFRCRVKRLWRTRRGPATPSSSTPHPTRCSSWMSPARSTFANLQTEKLLRFPHELLGRPLELLIPDRFRGSHAGHLGDSPQIRPRAQ